MANMCSNGQFLMNQAQTLLSNSIRSSVFIPIRTLMPHKYGYVPLKKRLDEGKIKSLNWAKPLIARRKKEQEQAENKSDAVEEPHMLHLVHLRKTLTGRPWWEKEIAEELKLDGKLHQPVILKNIPSVNRMLNEIKHLITIQPLKFPHGIPENESDWEHTRINSRGEMVVIQRLKALEPDPETPPNPDVEKWKLDLATLKKDLDKKCQDYMVHAEYKPAEYLYRKNQDKKMYRYNFNKGLPKYDW